METIRFYILECENHENALAYHRLFENDLVIYRHHKFYLKNYFLEAIEELEEVEGIEKMDDLQEINYLFAKLQINDDFLKSAKAILNSAIKEVEKITKQDIEDKLVNKRIWPAIEKILTKYRDSKHASKKDIFDLTTDLLIEMLPNHYLKTSDKSLALAFLKGFMWECGYYLKWTWTMWKNHLTQKVFVQKFVTELEDKNHPDKLQIKSDIKYWIMKHTKIALYLRKD